MNFNGTGEGGVYSHRVIRSAAVVCWVTDSQSSLHTGTLNTGNGQFFLSFSYSFGPTWIEFCLSTLHCDKEETAASNFTWNIFFPFFISFDFLTIVFCDAVPFSPLWFLYKAAFAHIIGSFCSHGQPFEGHPSSRRSSSIFFLSVFFLLPPTIGSSRRPISIINSVVGFSAALVLGQRSTSRTPRR